MRSHPTCARPRPCPDPVIPPRPLPPPLQDAIRAAHRATGGGGAGQVAALLAAVEAASGMTPLMLAAARGHEPIMALVRLHALTHAQRALRRASCGVAWAAQHAGLLQRVLA